MKHKVTVVVCVIAIFVAGVLSVQAHDRYVVWRNAVRVKAVAASAAEAHKNAAQQKALYSTLKSKVFQLAM